LFRCAIQPAVSIGHADLDRSPSGDGEAWVSDELRLIRHEPSWPRSNGN
jgi:hypothetical protein